MAGTSHAVFALFQTLTSTDLMTAFRLQGRDVLEIARYLTGDGPIVLGGLTATPTAAGVVIAPGLLLEPYAGVVDAPRPDESPTVLGLLRAPRAVALPVLPDDTWYLVEARAGQVDALGSRLITDPVTKISSPAQVVVQREASLVLRARAGTGSAPPATVAGWQPLAAVLRPAVGDILEAEILDRRNQTDLRQLTTRLSSLEAQVAAFARGTKVYSAQKLKYATAGGGGGWVLNNVPEAISVLNAGGGYVELGEFLPQGSKITALAARVVPGAARSGTDRIRISLQRRDIFAPGANWEAVGAAVYDNATINEQTIAITGLSEVVDLARYAYEMRITAGSSDPDPVGDKFIGGSVTCV